MRTMIFSGSFDPPTRGHLDLIRRASALADKLVVAILDNPRKQGRYSVEQRKQMLERIVSPFQNVEVDCFGGLLADYAARRQAYAIVRGVRNVQDYEYERDMAHANQMLCGVETVFLLTDPRLSAVSSSVVRELLHFGGDVTKFVPEGILDLL